MPRTMPSRNSVRSWPNLNIGMAFAFEELQTL